MFLLELSGHGCFYSKLTKKTLPGGVVVEDLKTGTGKMAKDGQRVSAVRI